MKMRMDLLEKIKKTKKWLINLVKKYIIRYREKMDMSPDGDITMNESQLLRALHSRNCHLYP